MRKNEIISVICGYIYKYLISLFYLSIVIPVRVVFDEFIRTTSL